MYVVYIEFYGVSSVLNSRIVWHASDTRACLGVPILCCEENCAVIHQHFSGTGQLIRIYTSCMVSQIWSQTIASSSQ